ncbi:hypothetical protein [Amycolatopsis vancoresmycina]|uniref:TetR family transcriptional regulator n=1 Tax=Amycolatopsis vancoresmycina DSM 44592 TaxID=1292037 RepID=R1G4F9_9PSEU|nr:hypothetical protein [Amycolatopsis vancoresmycina]EOD66337.1 TetR family transcriptional regulator [Amycolatopsis vancoresmycina DSM 44592]
MDRHAIFRADLRDDIEAGIADGVVDPGLKPGDAAIAIIGQLRGIALPMLVEPSGVGYRSARRARSQKAILAGNSSSNRT